MKCYFKEFPNVIGNITEFYNHEETNEECVVIEYDPPVPSKDGPIVVICTWKRNVSILN